MSTPAERKRDAATIAELAAAKADMTATVARHIEYLLDAYAESENPLSVAEAANRARAPVNYGVDDPQQVSWHMLANLIEHEPERGAAVWESIKAAARQELQTGTRAARAVERQFAYPYERAEYLVILEALTTSLEPRGGVEHLLVQQMATAYEQALRWQMIATQRTDQEGWAGERDRRRMIENMSKRDRERYEYEHGWMAPRVSDLEAIDQAVLIGDRYQRSFLRILRTYRDLRRVLNTVVMTGGQLNVAERQTIGVPDGEDGGGAGRPSPPSAL
jgi:hypothetical protein